MNYVAERHNGSWFVVETTEPRTLISEHGAGKLGAAAAQTAVETLTQQAANAPRAAELRAWRRAHKLTQTQLGNYLGVTLLTIHRWETAQRTIPHPLVSLALSELDRQLA